MSKNNVHLWILGIVAVFAVFSLVLLNGMEVSIIGMQIGSGGTTQSGGGTTTSSGGTTIFGGGTIGSGDDCGCIAEARTCYSSIPGCAEDQSEIERKLCFDYVQSHTLECSINQAYCTCRCGKTQIVTGSGEIVGTAGVGACDKLRRHLQSDNEFSGGRPVSGPTASGGSPGPAGGPGGSGGSGGPVCGPTASGGSSGPAGGEGERSQAAGEERAHQIKPGRDRADKSELACSANARG